MTECTQTSFTFADHGRRQVVARFDGGMITSDGGAMLLRQTEQRSGIVRQFAACFRDHRQPAQVEHSVRELVSQRVYGLALGYEDLNDHDQLRSDPLLALLSGKQDLEGKQRRRAQDRGKAGAGKSTLNRLELTPAKAGAQSRYKKIVLDTGAADRLLTSLYIQSQPCQPERIVLDLDATEEVRRIVEQLRRVWPEVEILLRADSGFCRDEIMSWCENQGVDYVFGLAKKRAFRAPDQETDEAGAAAFRQEGQGGPGVRGFPLPHANQLGAGAQGGGQGGVSGEGRKPAFRGDVADAQASGGATLIRDDLLRPRRDGEPHQGAAAGAVRRPHLDRAIAVESDPLIFFIDRVLFAGDAAAAGVGGDEDGAGAMHDDPAAVVEDRSAHPDHGAQSVDFAGDGIRLGGGVRPSV